MAVDTISESEYNAIISKDPAQISRQELKKVNQYRSRNDVGRRLVIDNADGKKELIVKQGFRVSGKYGYGVATPNSYSTTQQDVVSQDQGTGDKVIRQNGYLYRVKADGSFETVSRPYEAQRQLDETIALNKRINRGEDIRARDLAYGRQEIDLTDSRTQAQSGAVEFQRQNKQALVEQRKADEQKDQVLANPFVVNSSSLSENSIRADNGSKTTEYGSLFGSGTLRRDSNNTSVFDSDVAVSKGSVLTEVKYTPTEKFFKNIKDYAQEKEKQFPSAKPVIQLLSVPVYASERAVDTAVFVKNAIFSPIKTGKETAVSVGAFFKNPFATGDKFRVAIINNPSQVVGYAVTDIYGAKGVGRATSLVKDVGVVAVGKYVSPAQVIDAQVLAGKSTFPMQRNIAIAESEFKATLNPQTNRYSVVSAGPTKYPSSDLILGGTRGLKNLEDVGAFTTPKGRASAYFLQIGAESSQYKFSLNPLSPFIDELKSAPTITEFQVSSIAKYPRQQIASKGFVESNKYLRTQAGTGASFITKRSTLGQTGEIEAVIPEGTKFKYNDKILGRPYTVYKGRVVRLRTAVTEGEGVRTPKSTKTSPLRNYFEEQRASSYYNRSKSISPNFYASLSRSSSKSSSARSLLSSSVSAPSSRSGVSSGSSISSRGSSSSSASKLLSSFSRGSSSRSGSGTSSVSRLGYSPSLIPNGSSYAGFPSQTFTPTTSFKMGRPSRQEGKPKKMKFAFKSQRRTKYTPTAYAVGFGIKGKKLKGTLSGLEFRGVAK